MNASRKKSSIAARWIRSASLMVTSISYTKLPLSKTVCNIILRPLFSLLLALSVASLRLRSRRDSEHPVVRRKRRRASCLGFYMNLPIPTCSLRFFLEKIKPLMVCLVLLLMLVEGCSQPPSKAVTGVAFSSIVPAPAMPSGIVFSNIDGSRYIWKNGNLISVQPITTPLPTTNIVITYYGLVDGRVYIHTGLPTPDDMTATSHGFWTTRTTWVVQTSTDMSNWVTMSSMLLPNQAHGYVIIKNDFTPQRFFRMEWQ